MQAKKFETFIKLMGMTSSSNDGECLAAIRKANSVLMETNVNWEDLLRGKVTTEKPSSNSKYQGKKFTNADEINTMFEALDKHLSPTSAFKTGFVDDVQKFWEDQGFLTEKQYKAILTSYERI